MEDKASSKNLRKRPRSKSIKDETGPDLKARSHKQRKVTRDASSPHEEAKRGKSERKPKRKQKSADRCGSRKSPAALQVDSEDPEYSMEDFFGLSCFDIRDEFKEKGSGRQQGLYPAEEHLYWRKKVLKVHFMNFSEQPYGQQLLTKEMIIGWMNEWRGGEESSVPKFELVGKRDGSDIRILFSSDSWSYLGNDAENDPMETMHLNLEDGPEKAGNAHHMKKYTVLHETGHALGFYHEHQHPDIGTDIFNKEIVISDLKVTDEFYEVNFGKEAKVNDETKFPFHKHSVMMYRVKESWIKSEFRAKILRNKRMRKYDEYYWPESALTGELPKEDKEGAHNVYKEIFPGEAAVRLPVQPRMDVESSIDLHSLLKDLRGDMILAVKSDMKWLADELHKKDVSFLNDEQYEEVTESNSKSKDSKARIVVEAVLNKVKQDDKNLEVFVDILKRNSQMFKALLEKLDNYGAGVEQPNESCMETDTGAGLGGLPRRMETDNSAMKLDVEDVEDVVEEVAPLAAVWDRLALKLHLKYDSIDIINRDNPRDSRACLTKAIAEWTKRSYNTEKFGVPSWRMLIIAVQSIDKALAQKIAAKHNVPMP